MFQSVERNFEPGRIRYCIPTASLNSSKATLTLFTLRRVRVRGPRGRQGGDAAGDQRAELHPLQDVRHQGLRAEHQLGLPRGRRRARLRRHVIRTLQDINHLSF